MEARPSLSVVFPNFNHARYLPDQLESMLKQSYRPDEIIIIDDASTDDSVNIIEDFMRKEPRIKLIRNERNMGVVWNINYLIKIASSDYIYLSAADDKVMPGFFEKSMSLLQQFPSAGLCSALGNLIDQDGEDMGLRALPVISKTACFLSPPEVQKKLFRYGLWINVSSMIVKREALVSEGFQVNELGSFADTFSALIIALRYGVCFIPEPMSYWRISPTGYSYRSTTNWRAGLDKVLLSTSLMRTTYKDLFPSQLVNMFERHWMYALSANTIVQIRAKQEAMLSEALEIIFPKAGIVSFAYKIIIILLFVKMPTLLWQIFTVNKYAPWQWWMFCRLSILYHQKKLVLYEKNP